MMKTIHLYFDIDGVLTNKQLYKKNKNISDDMNLFKSGYFSSPPINREFDFDYLIDILNKNENIYMYFLSSIGGEWIDKESSSSERIRIRKTISEQKRTWFTKEILPIFDNCSKFPRLILTNYSSDKSVYHLSTDEHYSILIDDELPNIEDWKEAGGDAIHFKDINSSKEYFERLDKLISKGLLD
jgi:hypothetical protein